MEHATAVVPNPSSARRRAAPVQSNNIHTSGRASLTPMSHCIWVINSDSNLGTGAGTGPRLLSLGAGPAD